MLLKLKLLIFNITTSLLLILFLCLGSQNLDERYRLNLLFNETVELPSGFIIGIAFTLGFINGGLTSTLNTKKKIEGNDSDY